MQVYGKNGYTAEIPVEIPKTVIAQELVAADGNTTLKDNNLDETHLLLHGTLGAGVKYIDCQNASDVSKFSVDNLGTVAGYDLKLPNHSSLLTSLAGMVTTSSDIQTQTNTNKNSAFQTVVC